MNPSRITTPLDKKFDEWWLSYSDRPLKFNVFIQRTRDIEAIASGEFYVRFYAVPDTKSLEKLGVNNFPCGRVESATYEGLRQEVINLVNAAVNALWDKVIVVSLGGLEDGRTACGMDRDKNAVKFQYAICYRSRDGTLWKNKDNARVSRKMGDMLYEFGPESSIACIDYSEEIEESLKALSGKLDTLAHGLRELVFKRTTDFVSWAKQSQTKLLNA